MPFFLLVPLWILCVLAGVALLFIQNLRRIGIYTITVSTASLLTSFVLSTAVLMLGPRLPLQWLGRWTGIVAIAVYLGCIAAGGLLGAILGFAITRKLLPNRPINTQTLT